MDHHRPVAIDDLPVDELGWDRLKTWTLNAYEAGLAVYLYVTVYTGERKLEAVVHGLPFRTPGPPPSAENAAIQFFDMTFARENRITGAPGGKMRLVQQNVDGVLANDKEEVFTAAEEAVATQDYRALKHMILQMCMAGLDGYTQRS